MIEPHRLIVEERRIERRGVVDAQVRARVGEQREATRVALRKTIQRERGDGVDDLLGGRAVDALARHARAQLRLDLGHEALAALEAERPSELLGLGRREAGGDHRHFQELLLEERHAERAPQDRLEARMRIGHGLAAAPAPDVGMDHVAHDRAGTDDRHLHDEVVEPLGPDARERRHLGAALDLEHADRVRLLQAPIHGGVVGRQLRQIDRAARLAHERQRILEHRHHAEPEEIDLDDAEPRAVVLVPLDDDPPRHGRGLEGHDVVEAARGDYHPARVLAQVARQVLDPHPERGEVADARVARVAARLRKMLRQQVRGILVAPVGHEPSEPVLHVAG